MSALAELSPIGEGSDFLVGVFAQVRQDKLQGAVDRLNEIASNIRKVAADIDWRGDAADAAMAAFSTLASKINEHADAINAIRQADADTHGPISDARQDYDLLSVGDGFLLEAVLESYKRDGETLDQTRERLAQEALDKLDGGMSAAQSKIATGVTWDLDTGPQQPYGPPVPAGPYPPTDPQGQDPKGTETKPGDDGQVDPHGPHVPGAPGTQQSSPPGGTGTGTDSGSGHDQGSGSGSGNQDGPPPGGNGSVPPLPGTGSGSGSGGSDSGSGGSGSGSGGHDTSPPPGGNGSVPPLPGTGSGSGGGGDGHGGGNGNGSGHGDPTLVGQPGTGHHGDGQPGNGHHGDGQHGNGHHGDGQPGNGQPGHATLVGQPGENGAPGNGHGPGQNVQWRDASGEWHNAVGHQVQWQDAQGTWHDAAGQGEHPNATQLRWRDAGGDWHRADGQWEDSRGTWHLASEPQSVPTPVGQPVDAVPTDGAGPTGQPSAPPPVADPAPADPAPTDTAPTGTAPTSPEDYAAMLARRLGASPDTVTADVAAAGSSST